MQANRSRIRSQARESIHAEALVFASSASTEMQRTIALASERGASSWLTCRPLKAHGFTLSKSEFRDALDLRLNRLPPRLPSSCSCGQQFTVCHALSCPLGGFPSIRHNELRDVTARLLKRVSYQVAVEPHLQPLSGEQLRYRSAIADDQARLLVAFGKGGSNAPILMSGFLTLMRPRTVPTHLLPATPTMRGKNAVPMSSASGKWNTPALFPLFSPLREVWGNLRHLCSRGSPCSWPRNLGMRIARSWPPCGVRSASHLSVRA